MATRSDIRDYVRQQTLVEQDDFADAKIDVLINQGLHRLSARFEWPWLATSTTLSVVAGTTEYTMPTNLTRTLSIVRQDKQQRLIEVAANVIQATYGASLPSGTPQMYFLHGRTMYLDRVPTENITYDWLYFRTPSTLDNDTDVPEFAEEFHYVLADWAISRVWRREEDFTKAEDAEQDFSNGIEEMARFYLNVSRDGPVVFGGGAGRHTPQYPNMPWLDGVS